MLKRKVISILRQANSADASGDGYEIPVFDQGKRNDSDAAWARNSPIEPNTVEIAAKRSVFDNPE